MISWVFPREQSEVCQWASYHGKEYVANGKVQMLLFLKTAMKLSVSKGLSNEYLSVSSEDTETMELIEDYFRRYILKYSWI